MFLLTLLPGLEWIEFGMSSGHPSLWAKHKKRVLSLSQTPHLSSSMDNTYSLRQPDSNRDQLLCASKGQRGSFILGQGKIGGRGTSLRGSLDSLASHQECLVVCMSVCMCVCVWVCLVDLYLCVNGTLLVTLAPDPKA